MSDRKVAPGHLVLGIDPGETTGLCVAQSLDGKRGFAVQHSGIVQWEQRHQLYYIIKDLNPDHIVIENFRLYRHKAQAQVNNEFPSVRIIGIVDLTCQLLGLSDRITFQMASQLSGVQVREEHMATVGTSEHEKDSYKHVRLYVLTHQTKP